MSAIQWVVVAGVVSTSILPALLIIVTSWGHLRRSRASEGEVDRG
jgi:hypothetical protein